MTLNDIIKLYNIKKYQKDTSFGDNIRIAIIDTGLEEKYIPSSQIIYKQNCTYDNNGFIRNVTDYAMHGTLVTSIIHSIAPNSELIILKAMGKKEHSIRNFVQCILKAIEMKADIMNISMSCAHDYLSLENVIKEQCKDELIFVASGNGYNKSSFYPSSYENVISIGSCNIDGKQSYFSNNSKDDIYLIGENLEIVLGGNTYTKNGTSFSCAIASGISALYLQEMREKGISDKKIIKEEIRKKLIEL